MKEPDEDTLHPSKEIALQKEIWHNVVKQNTEQLLNYPRLVISS